MAAKKAHGTTIETYDTGAYLYSLMSDGIILRQWRYEGRLEGATIFSRTCSAWPDLIRTRAGMRRRTAQ